MNQDIRLSVGFWQHWKTKKTIRRLGLEGARSVQVLWLWAAGNRPDGALAGMDWEDIELAADWQGEPRAFFDLCLGGEEQPMWIERAENGYRLREWQEHNPWVAVSDERQDRARFCRLAAVDRPAFERLKAAGVTAISKGEYERVTRVRHTPTSRQPDADATSTPAPAPAPAPTHKDSGGENARAREVRPERETTAEAARPGQETTPEAVRPDRKAAAAPRADRQATAVRPLPGALRAGFLACWREYPVKQAQEMAWREWQRLSAAGLLPPPEAVRQAIARLRAEDAWWARGKIPKFSNWLNGKRWADEPHIEPSGSGRDLGPPGPRQVSPHQAGPQGGSPPQRRRQEMEALAAATRQALAAQAEHTPHPSTAPSAAPEANYGDATAHQNGNRETLRQLPAPPLRG